MVRLYFSLILVFIFNSTNAQWLQMGNNINGETYNEYLGTSVSLNSKGDIIAIGCIGKDYIGNGIEYSYPGHVKIFSYNDNLWSQIGSDIIGIDNSEDYYSVSLNSDGSIVAIGTHDGIANNLSGVVRIFKHNGNDWVQLGNNIEGDNIGDKFGNSVSINDDGSIVAIGAPQNDDINTDAGKVKVFGYNGNDWIQIGDDIPGLAPNKRFGYTLDLNQNGNILAIGAPYTNANGYSSGNTAVYEFDGSTWIIKGLNIYGEAAYNNSGTSVSLSSDGNILAIGAPNSDVGDSYDSNKGHVKIYEYNGAIWVQKAIINGENDNYHLGSLVSLSSEDTILAVRGNSGQAKVFEYNGEDWVQINNYLNDENNYSQYSSSISLSSNGKIFAVSSPSESGKRGQVKVFCNCDSVIIDTSITQTIDSLISNADSVYYQWVNCENNFAIIEGENNKSFYPLTNGNYAVIVTQNGCTDTSYCYNVSNIPCVLADFEVSDFTFQDSIVPEDISFLDLSVNAVSYYYYYYKYSCDDASIPWQFYGVSFESNGFISFEEGEEGCYRVFMLAEDIRGCTDTTEFKTFRLYSDAEIEAMFHNIQFYPNPTNGKINIISSIIDKIEVINDAGQLIYQTIPDGIFNIIDLSIYAKGLYLLKFTTDKRIVVEKVVLE